MGVGRPSKREIEIVMISFSKKKTVFLAALEALGAANEAKVMLYFLLGGVPLSIRSKIAMDRLRLDRLDDFLKKKTNKKWFLVLVSDLAEEHHLLQQCR